MLTSVRECYLGRMMPESVMYGLGGFTASMCRCLCLLFYFREKGVVREEEK